MDYRLIVVILALLGGAYNILLNAVKFRSLNNPTPANLTDVYDAETYEKWKKYGAEHCKVQIVFKAIYLIITLILLLTNAYASFANLFPSGAFMQLLAVILLECLVNTVVSVVENYISDMKIEEKYGFNRTTMKTFVGDRIREFVVELLLSVGIASLVLVLYNALGGWMVLLFVAVMLAFTALITFIAPILSRIGNKFTPLEDGELKTSLVALLTKHGYQVKAIEVMDASRRTTKLNASFSGFGKLKTIVLYDNLINAMTPNEISAVFAHELGHGIHKHLLKRLILNLVFFAIIGLLAWLAVSVNDAYIQFGFTNGVNYGFAYILLTLALSVIQPLTNLGINALSRKHEYQADKQAVQEGFGIEMITAFKKLAKGNFAHLSPSKLNVLLEYSHPPLNLRIENVEKEIANLNK